MPNEALPQCAAEELGLQKIVAISEGNSAEDLIGTTEPCEYILADGRQCPFQARIDEDSIRVYDREGRPLEQLCPAAALLVGEIVDLYDVLLEALDESDQPSDGEA